MKLVVAALLTWSTLAMAIESPTYETVARVGAVEVRRYAAYVVAETEVESSREEAGNQAFRRLGGYIFGANASKAKIAMTAPVVQAPQPTEVTQQARGGGRWLVQFSMPAAWDLATLPKPDDPRVALRRVPSKLVAVLRYSGTWSEANFEEHRRRLAQALEAARLAPRGEAVWARYDPPYTPWFLRTNEVQYEVSEASVEALATAAR